MKQKIDLFCEKVAECLEGYLIRNPEKDAFAIETVTVDKVNVGEKHGIVVRQIPDQVGCTMYMEDYFKEYENGAEFDYILCGIADDYDAAKKDVLAKGLPFDLTWDGIKDRVYVDVIGATLNKRLLDSIPHVKEGDICATYRILISDEGDRVASCQINNGLLASLGISKEELHRTAIENSQRMFPPVCMSIGEAIGLAMSSPELQGMDDPFSLEDTGDFMYVLTNNKRMQGAAVLFYPGVMEKVQDVFPEGVYLAPSSIHEVLLVPKGSIGRSELEHMVYEINRNEVSLEDRLSDNVHQYDAGTKKLYTGDTPPLPEKVQEVKREGPVR